MIETTYFFSLLNEISFFQNDKYYMINNDAFKKIRLIDKYEEFIDKLKPFYPKSKQFYLTRPPKYNNFTTLLRHVCKANNVMYSSKIKYDKSKYEIIYYIYKTTC